MAASRAGSTAMTRARSTPKPILWDLTDPETRRIARTLSDHVIEVTVGDEVGYGIMEYGVAKGFANTTHQHFPAIEGPGPFGFDEGGWIQMRR